MRIKKKKKKINSTKRGSANGREGRGQKRNFCVMTVNHTGRKCYLTLHNTEDAFETEMNTVLVTNENAKRDPARQAVGK